VKPNDPDRVFAPQRDTLRVRRPNALHRGLDRSKSRAIQVVSVGAEGSAGLGSGGRDMAGGVWALSGRGFPSIDGGSEKPHGNQHRPGIYDEQTAHGLCVGV